MPILSTIIQYSAQDPSRSNKTRERNKGHTIGKEEIIPISSWHDPTLRMPYKFYKTIYRHNKYFQQSDKIQNQHTKQATLLYTNNKFAKKILGKITFTTSSKIPRNRTKEVKDSYIENCKTLNKEIEEDMRS